MRETVERNFEDSRPNGSCEGGKGGEGRERECEKKKVYNGKEE